MEYTQLAMFALIAGVIVSLFKIGDRLWLNKTDNDKCRIQSQECKFEHSNLERQNVRMLEMQVKMLEVLQQMQITQVQQTEATRALTQEIKYLRETIREHHG